MSDTEQKPTESRPNELDKGADKQQENSTQKPDFMTLLIEMRTELQTLKRRQEENLNELPIRRHKGVDNLAIIKTNSDIDFGHFSNAPVGHLDDANSATKHPRLRPKQNRIETSPVRKSRKDKSVSNSVREAQTSPVREILNSPVNTSLLK